MGFFALAIVIIAILYFNSRIGLLEKRVEELKASKGAVSPSSFSPSPQAMQARREESSAPISPMPQAIQQAAVEVAIPPAAGPQPESALVNWIKEDFFMKLGALLLLIAFGWFVSYAFANNWIGPWGRIIAGVLAGAAIYALGVYRIKTERQQGSVFLVLGSAVVVMSLWAAREIYDFLTPLSALVLMTIPVILTAGFSVHYRLPSLALASFLIATVAPALTAAPEPDIVGLSVYMLLIAVGTLWVGYAIDALFLTPTALAAVAFWNLPYLSGEFTADLYKGLLFSFMFTGLFFVSSIVNLVRHHVDSLKVSHVTAGIGLGVYQYAWIAGVANGAFESFLYAAWMALFALAGFLVYKRTGSAGPLYIYGAIAIAYLVALTASLFTGVVLTVVYAAELAALIVVSGLVPVGEKVREFLAWLYLPLGLLSLQHVFSSNWWYSVLHEDFFALLAVTASLCISAWSLRLGGEGIRKEAASNVLFVGAGISGLIMWWLVLTALVTDSLAAVLFFITVGIMGALCMSVSARFSYEPLMRVGLVVLWGFAVVILLSGEYVFSSNWADSIWHADAMTLLGIVLSFWGGAAILYQHFVYKRAEVWAKALISIAGVYSLGYLWLAAHALLLDSLATLICLVFYTVVGLTLFSLGGQRGNDFMKWWGGVLLGAVVARLLVVDVWALSLTMRIITFFVIGALLVSTAFIGRKPKDAKDDSVDSLM